MKTAKAQAEYVRSLLGNNLRADPILTTGMSLIETLIKDIQDESFTAGKKEGLRPDCAWTHCGHEGSWDTACGNKHQFTFDGPKENKANYCCYCGGKLKISKQSSH